MSDDAQDGGNQDEAGGSLDTRVGKLEAGQDDLKSTLNEVLGILKGGGGGGHNDEPNADNVGMQIRRQLDERDARNKADADKKQEGDRIGALETKLSELTEKPPQPMPTRHGKLMGWH